MNLNKDQTLMFGKLGDIASLLKQAPEIMRQAQEMQGKAAEMQERLAQLQVEGTAGGGMVSVTATGQQKILGVTIDPSLIADGDKEMLEDLLVAAVNQAIDKARAAASEEMSKLTGNMNVPGMGDVMSKFGMKPPAPDADAP
jgi:DNA-binding YbaB/EbfC family protein